MSCVNISACQLACSPSAFPAPSFQLNKAAGCPSTYLGTKFPRIPLKFTSATYRYRKAATVCLFGGKGKSENGSGNEASPWKSVEKAVSNFKKDQSIEDVLKQQIQKQEYYDDGGGGGGKRPGGGGGSGDGDGDGDGFGEAEDESISGMWDEFVQVILATVGFAFLYIYIIEGEEITVIAKDTIKFLFRRQMSIRLRRLINQWKMFFRRMKEKPAYDPYWLEREILNRPTWFDHPLKYKWLVSALEYVDDDDDDEEE